MSAEEWSQRWKKGHDLVLGWYDKPEPKPEHFNLMFIYDENEMGEEGCCEGMAFVEDEFEGFKNIEEQLSVKDPHGDFKEYDRVYPDTKYFRVKVGRTFNAETKIVDFVVDEEGNEGILVNDWTKREYTENWPFPFAGNSLFIPLQVAKTLMAWSGK